MKIALVLTNDWELFGDGSGDYYDVQHNPTSDMLAILKEFDAKMTFMAEVGQQWAHEESPNDLHNQIAESWKDILTEMIRHNQDVQLHFHPQWINAEFQNNNWKLDYNNWAVSSLERSQQSRYLSKGKEYLEELLKPINNDYKCIAFRAGSYCIQPEKTTLSVLKELGFLCDTSVTKGLYSEGFYDFRSAYSNILPWFVDKNILKKSESNSAFLELPIYSEQVLNSEVLNKFAKTFYYLFTHRTKVPSEQIEWINKRDEVKSIRYPSINRYYKTHEKRDLRWYMSKFLSRSYVQLDYDYLPAKVFVKIMQGILEKPDMKSKFPGDTVLPVIASGHIKDAHNNENLKWIIKNIRSDYGGKIDFWTLTEAVKYVLNNRSLLLNV